MAKKNKAPKNVWGMPILLGVLIIAGLLLAIMGTGIWHILAWLTLFIPMFIMIKHSMKVFKPKTSKA